MAIKTIAGEGHDKFFGPLRYIQPEDGVGDLNVRTYNRLASPAGWTVTLYDEQAVNGGEPAIRYLTRDEARDLALMLLTAANEVFERELEAAQ